jgi:hypothetical protein
MRRRSFLKASGAIALGAGLVPDSLLAKIPPNNFDKYDFGGGPPVPDRLYQGPFSADAMSVLVTSRCEDGSLTLRQTLGLGSEDETGGVPRGPE